MIIIYVTVSMYRFELHTLHFALFLRTDSWLSYSLHSIFLYIIKADAPGI